MPMGAVAPVLAWVLVLVPVLVLLLLLVAATGVPATGAAAAAVVIAQPSALFFSDALRRYRLGFSRRDLDDQPAGCATLLLAQRMHVVCLPRDARQSKSTVHMSSSRFLTSCSLASVVCPAADVAAAATAAAGAVIFPVVPWPLCAATPVSAPPSAAAFHLLIQSCQSRSKQLQWRRCRMLACFCLYSCALCRTVPLVLV